MIRKQCSQQVKDLRVSERARESRYGVNDATNLPVYYNTNPRPRQSGTVGGQDKQVGQVIHRHPMSTQTRRRNRRDSPSDDSSSSDSDKGSDHLIIQGMDITRDVTIRGESNEKMEGGTGVPPRKISLMTRIDHPDVTREADDEPARGSKKRDRMERPQGDRAAGENMQDSWKEDLLTRVKELEQAQQIAEANSRKITAKKEALNKEVEHLRQIEQLRAPLSRSTFTLRDGPPQQHYPIICFKCREPGHKARECLQQSNARLQFVRDGDTDLEQLQ